MNLYNHQKEAIKLLIKNNGSGALFHSIGCGKTATVLETFKECRKLTPELKLYVICPLSLINAAWGEDIEKFTDFTYHSLREKKFKEADIYIVNYEYLLHNDIKPDGPAMIALDESSRMKNFKSKTTKKLLKIKDRFLYRIVMSGTAAPNCETEYWSQMSFVGDEIFHKSFYAFRGHYFHLSRGNQVMNGQIMDKAAMSKLFQNGWKYALTSQKREQLVAKIKPYCHYAKLVECVDMPEQIDQKRFVVLPAKLRSLYNTMKREAIIEIQSQSIVAQVALTKLMKLRQLCSGFAIDTDGIVQPTKENPKLKELKGVLDDIGTQQAIIWCQFQHEVRQLEELLKDRCVTLYGGTKDKDESIRAFKSGEAQFFIAHPRSAAHGLTLVNCNIQIFYALDYSSECYIQARGRTHRIGQKNPCTYIHLICHNTIEEDIYITLQRKGDAQDVVNGFLRRK